MVGRRRAPAAGLPLPRRATVRALRMDPRPSARIGGCVVTAWEDFGLDVAKVVVWIFAAAFAAGGLIAASAWLRDWRERRMWEQAEADAQAALDFAQADFQAHVTQAFNIAMTGTPL